LQSFSGCNFALAETNIN